MERFSLHTEMHVVPQEWPFVDGFRVGGISQLSRPFRSHSYVLNVTLTTGMSYLSNYPSIGILA
jgi:hypothetical protein